MLSDISILCPLHETDTILFILVFHHPICHAIEYHDDLDRRRIRIESHDDLDRRQIDYAGLNGYWMTEKAQEYILPLVPKVFAWYPGICLEFDCNVGLSTEFRMPYSIM